MGKNKNNLNSFVSAEEFQKTLDKLFKELYLVGGETLKIDKKDLLSFYRKKSISSKTPQNKSEADLKGAIEEILKNALLNKTKSENEKKFTLPVLSDLLKTNDLNTKGIYWIAKRNSNTSEFQFTKFEANNSPSKSEIHEGIAFELKFDTQDLHFRKWHRTLIERSETTLKKMLDGTRELTESYWFSDLYYKVVSTKEENRVVKLPFFTLYISRSHLYDTKDKNRRFLKYNRTILRARRKWIETVQHQFKNEAKIREKHPHTMSRNRQWTDALDAIKRALSRSLDGWHLDPVASKLFDGAQQNESGDFVKNGDLVSGYVALKKEEGLESLPIHYIVTIKNEDLIDTCSSRPRFLSERYASLIHLIEHNKDQDPKLPICNGLIEVFTLKDSRKDIWKRDLNLTEFNPDEAYDPISLLIEMGGDRFYEPILVHNEKAYSSFIEEMIGSSSDKKEDSNDQ